MGVIHRTAAPGWPAVAIDPDDVDVFRSQRDPLGEDPCALVDHRIDHPLDDLFGCDGPTANSELRRGFHDDPLDLRIANRRPRSRVVAVVAFADLLSEASEVAQ